MECFEKPLQEMELQIRNLKWARRNWLHLIATEAQ